MKCLKCGGELNLSFKDDYSDLDNSVEVRGTCKECNRVFYTFIKNDDLVDDEDC